MPIFIWGIIAIIFTVLTLIIFPVFLFAEDIDYLRPKKGQKINILYEIVSNICLISLIIVSLGLIKYSLISDITDDVFYLYSEEIETVEIYSIDADSNVSGRFVLFSGYVNEKQVYEYYYYKDDGYYRDYIYSKNVKIVMDDDETPRIYSVIKKYRFKWFIFHSSINNSEIVRETIIYLPEGSIIQDYQLN
jgi:hypothetical protein